MNNFNILLANPRGFCAGVERAIAIVERVLERYQPPIYVRHEVVHNRFVVDGLRQRGAIFIEDLADVPAGATLVFSAHGVPIRVRAEAQQRNLQVFDATCPLVTKVHLEVARYCARGVTVILIGHRGHPEVEGTLGQWQGTESKIELVETIDDVNRINPPDPTRIAYVTQTTLSVDDSHLIIQALRERFPTLQGPKRSDICYATQNRQNAVRTLTKSCDVMLVVGSPTSSNSSRLRELAEKQGRRAYLIDGPEEIQREWLNEATTIGLTAGASAPEILVTRVVERLQAWGATAVEEVAGIREQVVFALPSELATTK